MNIETLIDYFEEDGVIVALCPEPQVSSFGDNLDEAEKSVREALELFFEGCESMGTLHEVLEESGYRKVGEQRLYHKPIKSMKTILQRGAEAAYA